MKNYQKGSVVPLLLGVIALLVIGGGAYIYFNHPKAQPQATVEDDTGSVPALRNFNEETSSSSVSSNNSVRKNGAKYFSLNNELSIILPTDYRVFLQHGNPNIQASSSENGQAIFVASSSVTYMYITKVTPTQSQIPSEFINYTQKGMIDYVYKQKDEYSRNVPGENPGTLNEIKLGDNYFVFADGTRLTTYKYIQNYRRYGTYYKQNFYGIEFINNDFSPINSQFADQIVSTINFN